MKMILMYACRNCNEEVNVEHTTEHDVVEVVSDVLKTSPTIVHQCRGRHKDEFIAGVADLIGGKETR